MNAIVNLLSPEQVNAILAAYGTVEAWYAQASDYVSGLASNSIIEDIWV